MVMESTWKKFGAFVRRVHILPKSGPKPPDYNDSGEIWRYVSASVRRETVIATCSGAGDKRRAFGRDARKDCTVLFLRAAGPICFCKGFTQATPTNPFTSIVD